MWFDECFIIDPEELSECMKNDILIVNFIDVESNQPLCLELSPDKGGTLTIHTENMELAGDLIADLCNFLSVKELESNAYFPNEVLKFQELLSKVDEYQKLRTQLNASIAEVVNNVKVSILKSEDARVMGNMYIYIYIYIYCREHLKKIFGGLQQDNGFLIGEFNKRQNNYDQMVICLKEINQMIKKAAGLRSKLIQH